MKHAVIFLLFTIIFSPLMAQKLTFSMDTAVTTQHEVTIKGKRIAYSAEAGMQPVWNEKGEPIAGLFYTYYERSGVEDRASRPLVFSFNGGPGSASVWMHIAYTGPRLLRIDDEGYPVQPYGIKENPNSILDIADIVYINPVNTGYSRASDTLDKKEVADKFFGVNTDIAYLAEWLNTFVSRKDRWLSPKYLIGESYGTTRVSGLALELQESQWMYLNGVVLVSPTSLGIEREGPVAEASVLPYFAATAWYHKALSAELQKKDLNELLPEVEAFTINKLIPVLTEGGFVNEQVKKDIAAQMSAYSGLSEKVILQHNLVVPTNFFWKELLRDKGYTIGRLDSRYLGIDKETAGERPDYNAELSSWLHSFTPAINHYLRDELKFKTDLKYNMFGKVYPWDQEGSNKDNTAENLREAMAENPYLQVMIQSGYYDGATDYFNAKYNLWHIDPSGLLKDRLSWKGYRSGHMMYLRKEDLATATQDIRNFIEKTLPKAGQPAEYQLKEAGQ